jgi:hypothetical protein
MIGSFVTNNNNITVFQSSIKKENIDVDCMRINDKTFQINFKFFLTLKQIT